MKILQVLPYFAWSYGGPVRVVYDISQELSKKGHDVTIYTTDVGMNHRLVESDQIKFESEVKNRYFRCLNNWAANEMKLHISHQMRLAIKNELQKYDIVHLHEWRGVPNVYVWYYAQKYNVSYILQAHGAAPIIIGKQDISRSFSKILFDTIVGNKIVKGASKVIALTKTEAEYYKKMGADTDKIEVVPNGIDLSEYENLPKMGRFRRKYKIEDDEKVILYLGRLHRTKGIDLLVEAFLDISKEIDGIKLALVGPDDGYESALKELMQELKIDNKVLFTGFVSNDEKMAALVDADVFVTPSFSGFPVTFLEACACGTPVITTNKGDELEWIHDKVGYVVGYDKDQLRDAIIKVLSDDGLRRRFEEENKKLVRGEFGWNKIALDVERIYGEVAKNHYTIGKS
jgi:glycosyltransferase involved in cell wall biosynthesis